MQELSGIYKALIRDGQLSAAILDTTALVGEAIRRHGLSPVAAAALGRTMTAAAYLCSWLKEENSALHVTISGGGPGGKISVSGDGALHMRGNLQHPDVQLPLRADGKLDVGRCVGKEGFLTVVRDDGEGIPFVGTSALVSGEIAEDFSAYFLTSEQRPTAVALGVRVTEEGVCLGAGGVFLQPLPGASEETISFAEETIGKFSQISQMIASEGAEKILREHLGAASTDFRPIAFRCRCNRERAASALLSMGKQEALALLAEEGGVNVHCPDCNTDYFFDEKDIAELFE